MRAQGVPASVIAEHERRAEGEAYEVWPENWGVFSLFLALGTQWRLAGMDGTRVGIDYAAVPVVMDLQSVPAKRRRRWFEWIRLMEREALEVFRQRAD